MIHSCKSKERPAPFSLADFGPLYNWTELLLIHLKSDKNVGNVQGEHSCEKRWQALFARSVDGNSRRCRCRLSLWPSAVDTAMGYPQCSQIQIRAGSV